jgi:hypothetical protein
MDAGQLVVVSRHHRQRRKREREREMQVYKG